MSAVNDLHDDGRLGRRRLLQGGVAAGLGLAALPVRAQAGGPAGHVQRYAVLGRTGLRVSDISFGGSRLGAGEGDLVRHALDRGINYFDTADSYRGGESETTIGNALRGKRDRVFIASKTYTSPSDRRDSMMRALEQSLKRLRTDYIDVYFNHAVNDVDRVKNPEWREFAAQARQQGKIRFTGMSGHAGRLIECLDYALDTDAADVILVAYNFGQDPAFLQRFTRSFDFVARQPDLPRVLKKAKAKGVGVIAMKTLMGARLNDMRPFEKGGATFSQAAFRWVLSGGNADALIVSMTGGALIDEYLGASGWRAAAGEDLPLLRHYARLNGATHCRHGCQECLTACPAGVPIGEVLRARMYAVNYGDPALARSEYAMLPVGAAACLSCAAQPCTGACPHGVPVERLLRPTHRMLTRADTSARSGGGA
jgi:predicted aldo/keto reductase-like oxidoreductase